MKDNDSLNAISKLPQARSFNYIFTVSFSIFLAFIYSSHVFLIESTFTFSRYFFWIYALGECTLQVMAFVYLWHWVQAHSVRTLRALMMGITFFFCISQGLDFFLERLLSFSVWYGLEFVSHESPNNLLEILKATKVPLTTWAIGASVLFIIFILGFIIFQITDRWSQKKPIFLSQRLFMSVGGGLVFFLFLWDVILSPFALPDYSDYARALPWKTTFLPTAHEDLIVNGVLKDPWKNRNCLSDLDSDPFSLQRKPDVFLFVAESVREDFINASTAPHLTKFKEENISFPMALSNANATHLSWFSLFYSLYPFHFPNYQVSDWKEGGMPLQLLKKMGYEIRIYSASRLSFYGMDERLFGENIRLISQYYNYGMNEDLPCYVADESTINKLCDDVKNEEKVGGRVFIVFLESTHFGYSWPPSDPLYFEPIDTKINYLQTAYSLKSVEKIKNRYKNAIHYVDSLFGKFISSLQKTDSWKESIVIFTADHGEEFYEHGQIFHASKLTKPQLHIPLYYKMGTNELKDSIQAKITSHVDVFPTVLHYLTGKDYFEGLFQGSSLFSANHPSYVIGGRYNAAKAPYEFFIHNGSHKLIAEFQNKADVFHSRVLHILATKDEYDQNVPHSLSSIRQNFGEALDVLFSQ